MGTGPLVFVVVMVGVLAVVGVKVLIDVIRDRPKRDPVAESLAEAEQTYRTELRSTPVIGVPYDRVRSDGSHDSYPHMSDAARGVCIGYLETLFAAPARERTP